MPPQPDADGGANLKTIPGLCDQDAFGAIAWLWNMFGFGKKLRVLHAADRLGVQIASGYPGMDYGGARLFVPRLRRPYVALWIIRSRAMG